MPSLYLVDGMSHLYRAYYAIQGLTNKEGLSTNAVFGFTNMLRKLIQEEEPEYLGVAIDPSGPTVRHQEYREYKATRKPMPEDLREQVPYVHQVCQALRIPILIHEGYEADDVIGTLARRAAGEGLDVVVVTIDKDMFQLVGNGISVFDTRDMSRIDAKAVQEKMGVPPDRVVDVLSLVGDSSDNIPGAPGIGIKGAQKLISEYGSLDKLLESWESVKRKSYRESLRDNRVQIEASRELLRIRDELPLELDLESLKMTEPDADKVRELFTRLDFTSLLEDFLPLESEVVSEAEYAEVSDFEDLQKRIQNPDDEILAIAVEFEDSSRPVEIATVGFSAEEGKAFAGRAELALKALDVISSRNDRVLCVVHDLKSLHRFWQGQGVTGQGSYSDSMLIAYLLDPNQNDFSIQHLALEQLHHRMGEGGDQGDLFEGSSYGEVCERADLTRRLYQKLAPRLTDRLQALLEDIELPLVEVLAAMEHLGVRIDTAILEDQNQQCEELIRGLEARIWGLAGQEFNLNSPKQLSEILFEKMQLPTSRKTGKAGHYSTGVEVLEELAMSFEIARLILEYRELSKLKSTYLDALPRMVDPATGRVHTSYNQMVAATGRLSSSNPNLQNIPIRTDTGRRIRRAFVPEKGFQILGADYSQIELRVMAHLSQDPVLLEAFSTGEDIHDRTAREVFGKESGLDERERRRRAKVINFGIMYGLSPFGLARNLKIDRKEAQAFIDSYFQRYQGVRAWIDHTLQEAEAKGQVMTLFGRVRPVPEIYSKNWNVREFGKRTAINAPIQGTAADLIKKAMVSIFRRLRSEELRSRLILQVHDELVLEVADEEKGRVEDLVVEEMEGVFELSVPLKVDVGTGPSWYDVK